MAPFVQRFVAMSYLPLPRLGKRPVKPNQAKPAATVGQPLVRG